MHRYRTCGLCFESEIEIPGLEAAAGDPDVRIRRGAVAPELPGAVDRGPAFQAARDALLLDVRGVGRYLVRGGREIVIDADAGTSDERLRLFLLGSALGALIHQRGWLPLHASAVCAGDRCVAFAGPSGAGKSTLAAVLARRGYAVVCDDICPVEVAPGGAALVHSGLPRLKLWSDALAALEQDTAGLRAVRPELAKFELPTPAREAAPLRLATIYLLRERRGREPEGIVRLAGREKLRALVQATYRFRFLRGLGRRAEHFRACAAVVAGVEVCTLTRTWDLERIEAAADIAERDFAPALAR